MTETRTDVALRYGLAGLMTFTGLDHFRNPAPYVRIVPPALPAPRALVAISGLFEILGGLGLLVPQTRRFSAWGLITLLVAVYPANLYMATAGVSPMPGAHVPRWISWARLPFQAVLVAWAERFTRPSKA